MLIRLDEFSLALYRRLKADEDALVKTRSHIESKKKLIATWFDVWQGYEQVAMIEEANEAFITKHDLEVQLQDLITQEQTLLAKIKGALR